MESGDVDAATSDWARDKLYGSWRVQSAKGILVEADGTRTESESQLDGVLIFTPQHRMIAFVVHPGRTPGQSDADKLRLFGSMVTYSGRFRLKPGKYVLDIDWSSTALNQDEPQTRLFEVDGDTLRITVAEHKNIADPSKRNSNVLTAIREKWVSTGHS